MEQESRKTDRRVLKTKRAIRNAFAQLLSQKPLNEITVKDLSAAADINRKTFYNYYRDIHQVVDEIENEIVSAFESAIQDVDVSSDLRKSYVVFSKLTAIISGDLDFYGHLFGMNNDAGLIAKIMTVLKHKFRESFAGRIAVEGNTLDFMVDYAAAGIVAVYHSWLSSGCRMQIETIAERVSTMTFNGINGLLLTTTER